MSSPRHLFALSSPLVPGHSQRDWPRFSAGKKPRHYVSYLLHLPDGRTTAQRGSGMHSVSHSQLVAVWGPAPRLPLCQVDSG